MRRVLNLVNTFLITIMIKIWFKMNARAVCLFKNQVISTVRTEDYVLENPI